MKDRKGEGRIYQRPGRPVWMLDYYAPAGGKMVRVRESSGTADEKAARGVLRDRVAAARVARNNKTSVELPANRRVSVGDVLEEYLSDLGLREKKGAAAEEYRLGPDSPLCRALGSYQVSALTREALVKYAEDRRKAKRSNATINRDLEGLKAALRLAMRAKRVFQIPAFPEKLRGRIRRGFFDRAEVERLCEAGPAWLAEMIRFAFATGWRRGELLGLRWEWVDWEEREIRLPDTKNGEGRVIPIAGELPPIMERLRERRSVTRADGSVALSEWVFHDQARPITRKRFVRAWNAARKSAKLEGRLFHDLRRSGVRRLINAGVSQAVAMRVSGHATASIFRRYQIVETADVAQALERVASRREKASGGTLTVLHSEA